MNALNRASGGYDQDVGSTSQYSVASTVAANGIVTTVTTTSYSGSVSAHDYWSNSTSSSGWQISSGYGFSSSGSGSGSAGANGDDSLQSHWQQIYTTTAQPGQAATTTSSFSGGSHASGDAYSYSSGNSWSQWNSNYGGGYSYDFGLSQTWNNTTADHYDDHTSWSETYGAMGLSSSSDTATNHVWGAYNYNDSTTTWWSSPGVELVVLLRAGVEFRQFDLGVLLVGRL